MRFVSRHPLPLCTTGRFVPSLPLSLTLPLTVVPLTTKKSSLIVVGAQILRRTLGTPRPPAELPEDGDVYEPMDSIGSQKTQDAADMADILSDLGQVSFRSHHCVLRTLS